MIWDAIAFIMTSSWWMFNDFGRKHERYVGIRLTIFWLNNKTFCFAKIIQFVYYFDTQIYGSYCLHGRSIRVNKPWCNQPTRAISHQNTTMHKTHRNFPVGQSAISRKNYRWCLWWQIFYFCTIQRVINSTFVIRWVFKCKYDIAGTGISCLYVSTLDFIV